ncbi:D-alanine--D-alanine ligase [Candidatus Zixiibacteriota bacterium]
MKVGLLLAGDSPEREVSLETGRCVAKALIELGHEFIALDTVRGGDPLPADLVNWGEGPSPEPPELINGRGRYHGEAFAAVEACRSFGAQVIFNALHGGIGEDGTLQAYLDLVGIPYTGSGMPACALAMDKTTAKRIFQKEGVRTPRGLTIVSQNGRAPENLSEELTGKLGLPMVVKPNDQGSTVGLEIVEKQEKIGQAFVSAARYSSHVVIEEYIPGRELTVALLEDRALPIVEILAQGGLYDYTCKYTNGKSQYLTNLDLSPNLTQEIQRMSLEAFRILGCYGYARADLRLDPGGVPYLLEINTLPGMTGHSLVPMAARAEGMEFPELVGKIIELAIERD